MKRNAQGNNTSYAVSFISFKIQHTFFKILSQMQYSDTMWRWYINIILQVGTLLFDVNCK